MEAYSSGELASLARRTIRILVVDDNLQEQQILKLKLEALSALTEWTHLVRPLSRLLNHLLLHDFFTSLDFVFLGIAQKFLEGSPRYVFFFWLKCALV